MLSESLAAKINGASTYISGLMISQTSYPDIFQEGGLVYIGTYTNLTGQVVKLVGQMPNLPGKCPVTLLTYALSHIHV